MARWFLVIILAALLLAAWVAISKRREDALVVYCAHDLIFAESILRDFEEETGTKVVVVGDTEATKSLGLVQRLIREKDYPVCDVFWNNQVLGTMQLADEGVLSPYRGSGYERIPKQFKDPEGLWTGFAGRLRVWIVNKNRMSATQEAVDERLNSDDLSRMAIAMPLYGTTLSHFSLLWDVWGENKLKKWHADARQRGLKVVQGNAQTKNLVAEGICDLGWTDTDDFFVALDDGFPVEMLPIRVEGKTICQPNSVAIINGTKKRQKAEQLVDYLLSKKIELKLASGQARQIPLGTGIDPDEMPEDVRPLAKWAKDSVNITDYVDARSQCLEWLLEEYAP